jgi:hypothetical protein
MTCGEIKERTIDYLYGELPERDRATFEAHLGGCDACRVEVAALQGTLHTARVAVRALDEAPPARVRVAVLETARAAAAGRSAPAEIAAAASPRRPEIPPKVAAPGGFWGWLRAPWAMPLVGAAAVVAIFVVGREVITDRSALRTAPSAPSSAAPEPIAAPAPPASAQPQAGKEQEPAPPRDEVDRLERSVGARPARRPMAGHARGAVADKAPVAAPRANEGFAAPPPPRPAARSKAPDDDSLNGGMLGGGGARRDRKQEAAGAGSGAAGVERRSAPVAPAAAEKKQVFDSVDEAAPVAKRASAPRSPAPAAAPAAAEPPPAPAPAATASRRWADAPSVAASAPAEEEVESAPAKPKAKKGASSPFEEQVQKAERLFSSGRWSEAAAAYRELLRLHPEHRSVPAWKGRLRACEQALAP